jgi:hypothetical protein
MNRDRQLTDMLIPFYLGDAPDLRGRTIEDIWAWDFETLECTHDYIQWLFPIVDRSAFNLDAPIVDAEIIQAFKSDRRLQQNLLKSFAVMLRFYGLQCQESSATTIVVSQSTDYPIRKQEWVHLFDHNYLRITRILKCLMAFGLATEARSFYQCLQQIYQEDRNSIGGETFAYWTKAIE